MQVDKDGEKRYYNIIMENKELKTFKITKFRHSTDIKNGSAVAVGGFDGVHIGHRAMIVSLVNEAKRNSVPAVVFTFDAADSPKSESRLLAADEKKNLLLSSLGVDAVVSVPFSEIRDMRASDFVKTVFVDLLHAKSIVCGYDFRFGNKREGDVSLIKALLPEVNVSTPNAVVLDGTPVSSTLIRNLIANGDFLKANALLGHSFSFRAEVEHGRKLGRTLGFPTINQKYPIYLATPRFGVYAVRCNIDGKIYEGVANVGVKPTVGGEDLPVCETHIFGYSEDCYGKSVETEFIAFIREEEKFSSLDALKERVLQDMTVAKNILEEF